MSPMRGVDVLEEKSQSIKTIYSYRLNQTQCLRRERVNVLPFSHAFFQVRQKELAVEGINGRDVGKDVFHHIHGEHVFSCFF